MEELAPLKRNRGSVVLMCLVLVVATTTVILAECDLTTVGLRYEAQAEKRRDAEYAFDGAIAQVVDDYFNDAVTLPLARQIAIGDVTGTITVSDNSATLPRSLKVDGHLTARGSPYTLSRIVGARHPPSVFFYALAVAGPLTSDQPIETGAAEASGDMLFGGSVTLSAAGNVVNGDLESAGAIAAPSTTVTGSTLPNAPAVPFPSFVGQNYVAAADTTFSDSAMNGYTFALGGSYPLVYCGGDLTIQGTFSGKGTIFVAGDVEVAGNMSYADSSSELVIIAAGGIDFDSGVTNAVGYFFTPNSLQIAGGLAITRGAIAAGDLEWTGMLDIAGDPDVWNTGAEGHSLKLPGMWP